MKKILTGDEQTNDTFITTLIKLFGIEKYNVMEKFCEEIEMSFSILNERNIKAVEYFEFLNSIKFDLMEEYRSNLLKYSIDNMNIEKLNLNSQVDAMDMDEIQKDKLIDITSLLEESNAIEPCDSYEYSNPLFNTNFYIIFILVLIINNQMDSARYLYRRLPEPILRNRTLVFIKVFLSFMLKKDVGKAISILNKEIENEIKKESESTEKEEDLIEEDILDRIPTKVNKKVVQKSKEDEKMDIYPSDKSSDIAGPSSKGRVIENNTPEQSSDNIIDIPQQQVDTPEEPMKDIEYDEGNGGDDDDDDDDNEEEEEDENDDDDNDDSDENYNNNEDISKSDDLTIKIQNQNTKQFVNDTMTPVDTETPLSYASLGNEISASSSATTTLTDTKKTYYKIKRCSLFIKELLICLLDKTRKRQINLIAKAYDHILVKEVAKILDYSVENITTYLTENYGWEVEPAQDLKDEMMFIPKRDTKEKKQEMSINHIDTLINHLIFLEDSDKIQKIDHF
eukprot:jgi/Orpsp1_1/1180910/evm.model.c7180000075099.1